MKKTPLIITATLACLLFSACFNERMVGCFQSRHSLIRVCYPSEKLLREAETKYTDHVPLTADDFKHLVLDDTVRYKIVVVYSYCCGPCKEAMPSVYVPLMQSMDTSRCRMLFVLDDCGSLPWNAEYLNQYGISTRYYLRDADSMFRLCTDKGVSNLQDWTTIANYTFQPRHAFTDCNYAPLTFIVSPDGRVKQVYEQFNDYHRLTTYDLRDMVCRDSLTVYQLDFDRVDTLRYNYNYGIDNEDIYQPDTVTFRTYQPKRYCTPDGRCY